MKFPIPVFVSTVFAATLLLLQTPAFAETYTYDSSGRLTGVTYDDGSKIAYSYDDAGNMVQREAIEPTLRSTTSAVLTEIKAMKSDSGLSSGAKKRLKPAQKRLGKASGRFKKNKVKDGLLELSKGAKELVKAQNKGADVVTVLDLLVEISRVEAQKAIDAAIAGGGKQKLIDQAQAKMLSAQDQVSQGKPDKAIAAYRQAWIKATGAI